jgi:hypothetical protein
VGIAENFYARGMDAFVYAKGLAGGVRGKE